MRNLLAVFTVGLVLAQQQPSIPEEKSVPTVKTPDGKVVKVKAVEKPEAPKVKKPKFGFGKPKADRDLLRMGKMKEMAIGVPQGSPLTVGVKGADGKTEKLYGRMGNVTNEGFSMQTLRGGNLENMNLDFKDVASMKPGAKPSRMQQLKGPLLGAMSLMTLAGTVIAIVKK